MPSAPLPANESARLAALHELGILDTAPDSHLDDLVQLASTICATPMALISLVDRERQWFKARVGVDACETPRDVAFCAYAIHNEEPLVVEDATQDPRFVDSELVTGEMHLRFYAGMPLEGIDGHRYGTLCVLDTKPREITEEQLTALRTLARAVLAQIEVKRRIAEVEAQRTAREEEQQHYERLFSLSLDMICVAGTDGYFKEVNPAFEEALGYSQDELLSRPYLEFVHPDDQDATVREAEHLGNGERTAWFENRYRCADGSYRWLAWHATPYPEDGVMYAVARDVTEQKVTEELLRQNTALQNAVLDSANYSIISTELDGTILTFNAAAERWLGYKASEMVGLQTPSILHDPDEVARQTEKLNSELGLNLEPGFETFVARARRGGVDEQEWTYVRKDGSRFPAHLSVTAVRDAESGDLIGFLGIASDLTEKMQAAQRERQLLEILEATPELVGITDLHGNMRYLNGSGRLRLGLPIDTTLGGYNICDFHPLEDSERILKEAFPAAMQDGVWTGEVDLLSANGEVIPASEILIAHRDETGEVHFFSSVARDITELRRQQIELSEARDAAIEASRLKSQFLANMSHELRTPLNSIIGFSELLIDRIPGPLTEDQDQCVTDIFESGRHLLTLINDVLDLSKIEAGKMDIYAESIEMASLIETALSTVRPLAIKKGLGLRHELDLALPPVWADPGKVRQVLSNLLSNAIKFTEQGEVVVRARVLAETRRLEVDVIDTGIGLSMEAMDIIFEEFRQVDGSHTRQHEGTGLGLALCRSFLRLMGGEIRVDSTLGEGSTFTFALPMARGVSRGSQEIPILHNGHVLLVEDDARSAELARKILEGAGYLVSVASNGQEGVRLAREITPDVVVTDVLMPGKSGWDLLSELKADSATAEIPLILLSVVSDAERGHALGAFRCLVKPIDRLSLLAAVRQSLGQAADGLAGKKVLIVDDEPAVLRLGRTILEEAGAETLVADGGREGIAVARRACPDLLILDLMMPGTTGFDVVRELSEDPTTCEIPILILTAKDLTPEDWQELNGHIVDLMQKGAFRARDLLNAVERILDASP